MNSHAEDVARMQRFAAAAAARLPAINAALPPAARARCTDLAAQTQKLGDRTHHRIATSVVGPFSAGKSALVSLLVGDPALLPVSNVPTTGNVTAIRLHPAQPGRPTAQPRWWVSLLPRTDVETMIEHLVDEVRVLIAQNTRHYAANFDGYRPLEHGWGRLDEFGRAIWAQQPRNPDLATWLTGLARVRDAWAVGHRLLPDRDTGQLIPVGGEDEIRSSVEIGDQRQVPENYPEPAGWLTASPEASLDRTLLDRIQPLIARVTVDVEVDAGTWHLDRLPAGTSIEIVDLPGLNTIGGGRDRYLTERELARSPGVLVVLRSGNPETKEVTDFLSYVERERRDRSSLTDTFLAVANRFDELPCSDADRADRSADFRAVRHVADLVTGRRPDRTYFTSALAALPALGLTPPPGSLSIDPAKLAGNRSHWGEVATGDAYREHAAALAGYARDGGLEHLRRGLAAHVVEHGLDIHRRELRGLEDEIRDRLLRLREMAGAVPGADPGIDLRTLTAEVKSALRTTGNRLPALRDTAALSAATGGDLARELRSLVAREVHGWPQWRVLFRSVDDRHMVRVPVSVGPGSPEPPWLDDEPTMDDLFGDNARRTAPGAVPDQFPETTAELLVPFRWSLGKLREQADALLLAALDRWSAGNPAAVTLQTRLDDPQAIALLDRAALNYLRTVPRATFAIHYLRAGLAALPVVDPADLFPLPRDRALPWRRRPEGVPGTDRAAHQVVLTRVRHDMVQALTEHLLHRAGSALLPLPGHCADALAMITRYVPDPHAPATGTGPDVEPGEAHRLITELLDSEPPTPLDETGEDR